MKMTLGVLLVVLLAPVVGWGRDFNTTEELTNATGEAFQKFVRGKQEPLLELYGWDDDIAPSIGKQIAEYTAAKWKAIVDADNRSKAGVHMFYMTLEEIDKGAALVGHKGLEEYIKYAKESILEAKSMTVMKATHTHTHSLRDSS